MIRTTMTLVALALATPSLAADIAVIEAGAEPRQLLQYAPAVGAEQSLRLEMDVTMAMQMAGMDVPSMAVPTMYYEVVAVAGTATATRIPYTFTVKDAGVMGTGPIADAMKSDISEIVGSTGVVAYTPSGRSLPATSSAPEAAGAEGAQVVDEALAEIALALPEVPVGIGASWSVAEQVVDGGLTVDQTSTWTLVEARPGNVYVVEVSVSQKAGAQPMPSSKPGVTSELKEMTSLSTGRTVIDLGSLLPVEVKMVGEAKLSALTSAMGQEMPMTSTVTTETRLGPSK
ncbi:MAG: hypothetical protein KC912_20070 [Proteobacteria bacterium]|nr:hypothetical protein [Pseudomonadota bacterium]